jgi:outer membrane protein OmpA-like peptidoglycan-associated protein
MPVSKGFGVFFDLAGQSPELELSSKGKLCVPMNSYLQITDSPTQSILRLIIFILLVSVLPYQMVLAQKDDVEFKNVQNYFKKNDFDLAIHDLEELNAKYPDKAGLNFLLGYAYYHTTNQKYNIEEAPYVVFHLLGDLYMQMENYQLAYTNYYTSTRVLEPPDNQESEIALEALKNANNLSKDIYPYQVEMLDMVSQEYYSERNAVMLNGSGSSNIGSYQMIYQSDLESERYGGGEVQWCLGKHNFEDPTGGLESIEGYIPVISYGTSIILKIKNDKGYWDLYKADYLNGSFVNVMALEMINESGSNETSLVVLDESTLLFSSDRKGGQGGMDLWRVVKNAGRWGEAENLGRPINTEYNEGYLSNYEEIIYFSSDRPGGLGYYDIYTTSLMDNGRVSFAKLMQFPVNSGGNDLDARQFSDDIIVFSSDRGAKDFDFYYINKTVPVKEFKIIGEIPEEFLNQGDAGVYNDAILFDNLIDQVKNSDIETAVQTINEMETSQAIQVVSDLEIDQAAEIMDNIDREKAIDIIDGMEVEKAIDIVDAMSMSASVDVIGAVNEITSIQIVEEMETQKAAELLDQVDLDKASQILEGMEVEKAVDIVDEYVTEKTVEIVDQMSPEGAAQILDEFSDEKAKEIIEGVEIEKAVGVLGSMEEDKTKRIVDQFKEEMEEGNESDKIVAIIKSYFRDQVRVKESVIFKTVYFNFNSSELLILTRNELMVLIDFMNENPTVKIEVVGHTDHIGDWDVNLKISHDRAEEVFKFLRNNNIEKERIIFYGKGPAQPVDTNETDEGRQNNRRVEVILLQ